MNNVIRSDRGLVADIPTVFAWRYWGEHQSGELVCENYVQLSVWAIRSSSDRTTQLDRDELIYLIGDTWREGEVESNEEYKFCDVMPCGPVEFHRSSVKHTAFVFRV